MFVKTEGGIYYPLSRVEAIWSEGTIPDRRQFAEIADVGRVELAPGELQAVTENSYPMIHAQPGFYVLEKCEDSDGTISLSRVPIVGWLYTAERGMLPVTIEGVNNFQDDTQAVLAPDGSVTLALDCRYPNETQYLLSLQS